MLVKIAVIFTLLSILTFTDANAQHTTSVEEVNRWQAKFEEIKRPEAEGIPFLKWSTKEILVESTAFLNYTDIKGQFTEKVSQATLNSKPIPIREDGSFEVHFGFPAETTIFVINANDSKNRTYRLQYKITPIGKKETVIAKIPTRRWLYGAGAGITRLSLRQAGIIPFSQWALTLKGSVSYRVIPDQMDLGLSTFFNAIPIGSTSEEGYKVQYLGVNFRVVWNLIKAPSRLRMNISGGLYFNTSLSEVGFANMTGPQLYPEFIYVFPNGHSLLLYGKFSPVISGTQIVGLMTNRELAMGIHYAFPGILAHRMSVGIDLSQLSLSIPGGPWASTNTYSLSSGISF